MNEVSIGTLRIPQARSARMGERVAREALFRLLGKLQIGSLTLHEGPQSHHFGSAGKPQEPQAEVHIHDPAVYGQMLTGGSIAAGEAYIKGLVVLACAGGSDPPVQRQPRGTGQLRSGAVLAGKAGAEARPSLQPQYAQGLAGEHRRALRSGQRVFPTVPRSDHDVFVGDISRSPVPAWRRRPRPSWMNCAGSSNCARTITCWK